MKALIARKLGMTSVVDERGAVIGITLLAAGPNTVIQLKTPDTDGYSAVQVGTEENKKLAKAQTGHAEAAKLKPKAVREFRTDDNSGLQVGSQLSVEAFNVGDKVSVAGISKGKGFAGTIKRHGFARGPKTHGGRSYRRPGSIGSMFPQRIFPGKKMAGHKGHARVTAKNLQVALVDKELSVIGVQGSVPGPRKGLVLVRGDGQ